MFMFQACQLSSFWCETRDFGLNLKLSCVAVRAHSSQSDIDIDLGTFEIQCQYHFLGAPMNHSWESHN